MDPAELTIGIEEEYQIIDPHSRGLTSYVSDFLEGKAMLFRDQVKPEFLQSQVETGSPVCRNVKELRRELKRLRSLVGEIADRHGCRFVAAGTHPFSSWEDQIITNKDRYRGLVADMQDVARRLLVFGMHVHIGIPDADLRIDVMNQMTYFMPHILSLSTSSPFWLGRNTGLKSYRNVVFDDLPRTGLPEYFESGAEYEQFVQTLVRTHCIDEATKIWWDIRPNAKVPTLEFRICDCTTRIDEAIAIAALIQATVMKLVQLKEDNLVWRRYRRALIEENKWRAIKAGIDGELLDLGKEAAFPLRSLIEELIEILDDVVDPLECREEIEYIRTMLGEGTSADRQLRTYEETGSLEAVVDMLAEETIRGL